ncbi:MAG TPA: phosphotransferase [Mycobacteriales bacterium]|nr:phosphotransferase [Mycobacteriales bacterium]
MPIPDSVISRYEIAVIEYLGGRANRHWLVQRGSERAVLRRYQRRPQGDVGYELAVLDGLNRRGWPVPVALADPIDAGGDVWCLFRRLPGASKTGETVADWQRRGRLLARLHQDTQDLAGFGQRRGCVRAEELLADPALSERLRAYEKLRPEPARVLRWHRDRATEIFGQFDLRHRELIVLHGDFADRNLLYTQDDLTGIIDFEGTHLNHRASEFALAWRGKRDALVHAYDTVHPLDDIDWALLAPALWSWAFLGVADEIERMLEGHVPIHDFDWQVGTLLRRSPLLDQPAYRF